MYIYIYIYVYIYTTNYIYLDINLSYVLKCNLEDKHYLAVTKTPALIKTLLSNMTLNLTSSKW